MVSARGHVYDDVMPVAVGARGPERLPDVFHHAVVFDCIVEPQHQLDLGPRKHVAARVVVDVELVTRVLTALRVCMLSCGDGSSGQQIISFNNQSINQSSTKTTTQDIIRML